MKSSFVERIIHDDIKNIQLIDLQPKETFNQLLNISFCHLVIQKKVKYDLFLPSKLSNILAVGGLSIVTASSGCSLYDLIEDNQMGILVTPESPKDFQIAIEEIYHEVSEGSFCKMSISKYKNNAKEFAINHLQKENVINAFLTKVRIITSVN